VPRRGLMNPSRGLMWHICKIDGHPSRYRGEPQCATQPGSWPPKSHAASTPPRAVFAIGPKADTEMPSCAWTCSATTAFVDLDLSGRSPHPPASWSPTETGRDDHAVGSHISTIALNGHRHTQAGVEPFLTVCRVRSRAHRHPQL
jgi:hypothetical protein